MKRTSHTIKTNNTPGFLAEHSVILDISTSGRFWRSSALLSITLITAVQGESDLTQYLRLESEQESDEYSLLTETSEILNSFSTIITFNGNAFDIPHLTKKYAAYGLEDPFVHKTFRDLFLEYRGLAHILGLPGRHLIDYYEKLPRNMTGLTFTDDALMTLEILRYDSIVQLFEGQYEVRSAVFDSPDKLYYTMNLFRSYEGKLSLHDEIFHLIIHDQEARLCVHIKDQKLRVYHTDIENYFYLPLEGYSIHKTMAQYVDATRKEKAVRENCFHLVTYSDAFINNTRQIGSYIRSALSYLYSN